MGVGWGEPVAARVGDGTVGAVGGINPLAAGVGDVGAGGGEVGAQCRACGAVQAAAQGGDDRWGVAGEAL